MTEEEDALNKALNIKQAHRPQVSLLNKEDKNKYEIFDTIIYFLKNTKLDRINLETLKNILMLRHGHKSLAYPHHAKLLIKAFMDMAQMLDYGHFDKVSLQFMINLKNPEIEKFMKENNLVVNP